MLNPFWVHDNIGPFRTKMQMMNNENSAKPNTSNFTRRQFLSRTTLAVGAVTLSFPLRRAGPGGQ